MNTEQVITDPQEAAKAQTEAEKLEALRRYRWRKVFETEEGQAVLLDILDMCHVHHSIFGRDAREDAWFGGERNIGMKICAELIEASPFFEALIFKASLRRAKPINLKENEQ